MRGHEGEIILFEAAAKQLKQMGVAKLPELEKLKREYATLNDRKAALYEEYRKAKKQMNEYGIIKRMWTVSSIRRKVRQESKNGRWPLIDFCTVFCYNNRMKVGDGFVR